ncbi:hypothetical protein PAXINDRAFT_10150 [Paxillus involutus ATCC 200175]|nr:hypothetical protein PAXINDRAFT_10150 [Paxillus involutus ATCC 200175]
MHPMHQDREDMPQGKGRQQMEDDQKRRKQKSPDYREKKSDKGVGGDKNVNEVEE